MSYYYYYQIIIEAINRLFLMKNDSIYAINSYKKMGENICYSKKKNFIKRKSLEIFKIKQNKLNLLSKKKLRKLTR